MKKGFKITLIILTIIVVIINIPIIGGLFLPKSHKVTKTMFVKYDPENVYLFITNVKEYPKWLHRVKKVEIVSTNPSGLTSWQEHYSYGKPMMYQIMEAAPYSDLTIKTANAEAYYVNTWKINIKEVENGTMLTITEDGDIYNPFFRTIAKLRGTDYSLNEYMADLKEALTHQ